MVCTFRFLQVLRNLLQNGKWERRFSRYSTSQLYADNFIHPVPRKKKHTKIYKKYSYSYNIINSNICGIYFPVVAYITTLYEE